MAASSPPQVGVVVDKNALNAKLGALSQSTRKVSIGFQELIEFMAPYTAADLENLYGFTPEEANLFLSCLRGATEAPALVAAVEAMEFIPRTGGV